MKFNCTCDTLFLNFNTNLWIMFDRASPYKSVFKVLHERTMDFIDKALNSSIIASQNNRFIIIG